MLETRTIATIASPPDHTPGSLVPVKKSSDEQLEQRPKRTYVPVKQFLNNVADHGVKIGKNDANMDRRRKVAKMRMMYEGDQIIRWDEEKQIYINKKKAGDALYIDPVLATFIDIITAQVAKSRSTLVVKARSEERVEKQQAAKYATELLRDAASSLMNARNTQREIKYGFLLSGEAYRYTYFDQTVEGKGIEKPRFAVKVAKGTDRRWYCQNCHANGTDADLKGMDNPDADPEAPAPIPTGDGEDLTAEVSPKIKKDRCPKCDFPQVEFIGGRKFSATVEEGADYENIGDVNTEFPDSLEITVIGARDHISDALVVIRDRMVPRCVLEMTYPDAVLPSTGTPENLRYKEAANSISPDNSDSDTYTGDEAFEMLHFQEVWLNPAVYHGYKSPREEKLPSGDVLAKGAGIDFTSGGYYARVGKVIVDLYEQAIKDCWSHAVNSVTSSFHGQGEWDLIAVQEQKNELRSMQVNSVMMDSVRPLMARSGAIDADKIPNKPGAIIKISALGEEKPLSYALDRVPGGGGSPDAYILDDKLAGTMQQRSGAFSSTTDLPDAKLLGTATGVATLAEHASGRRAPMLALRAEMEKEQGYQYLECRKKYWPEAMYESLDKKVGGDAGRWFRESNIRRDFIVEVVPDSYLPQTAAKEASDFQQLMQVIIPLSNGDPAILKQMQKRAVELFGKGIDFDNYQLEKVEAAVRLERMKQIATFFETEAGIPTIDPTTGQPITQMVAAVLAETTKAIRMPHVPNTADMMMNPTGEQPDMFQFVPVDVLLDNHDEYAEIYGDWLKSSEGRESSLFLRTCVRTLINKHKEAKVQRVISGKTDANAANAPDIQAELIAREAAVAQEAKLRAEQAEQELAQQTAANDEMAAQQVKHQMVAAQLGLGGGEPAE
jgi:hypothetical protein